jgi:hypothetical protein
MVLAIVRHPEKLEKRESLTAKAGDVYDTTSLATLIQGNDAVISAFNPGWKNPNLYDDQVRGTASIIAAIKKAGIKPSPAPNCDSSKSTSVLPLVCNRSRNEPVDHGLSGQNVAKPEFMAATCAG